MTGTLETVQVVYEKGVLRPLKPLRGLENQVYLVTILIPGSQASQVSPSLRGKYRGYLSSAEEFSSNKQIEKDLER